MILSLRLIYTSLILKLTIGVVLIMDIRDINDSEQYKIRLNQFNSFMVHYMEQYNKTTNDFEWDYLTTIDLIFQSLCGTSRSIIWDLSKNKHKIDESHLSYAIGKVHTALKRLESIEKTLFKNS